MTITKMSGKLFGKMHELLSSCFLSGWVNSSPWIVPCCRVILLQIVVGSYHKGTSLHDSATWRRMTSPCSKRSLMEKATLLPSCLTSLLGFFKRGSTSQKEILFPILFVKQMFVDLLLHSYRKDELQKKT